MSARKTVRLSHGFTAQWLWLMLAGVTSGCTERVDPLPSNAFESGVPVTVEIKLRPDQIELLRLDPRTAVLVPVRVGSQNFQHVAVRLKGSRGSFRPIHDKPGFTLDLVTPLDSNSWFHGATKLHLNNSVEDPAYIRERLGTELFQAAEIPAPRVGRALVKLNGRRLGLYVLKEGISEAFVARNFKGQAGCAFEPIAGGDVDGPMQVHEVGMVSSGDVVGRLAAAASEPDLRQRWTQLHMALDVERFVRFMAAEVMLCHLDGYSLRRNNFRVYHDCSQDRLVFIPWGMDQLFAGDSLPWAPDMAGLVATAILEIPTGRQMYEDRFRELFARHFQTAALTGTVQRSLTELRPWLPKAEFEAVRRASGDLCARIQQRERSLSLQLKALGPGTPNFTEGTASLVDWWAGPESGGRLRRTSDQDGRALLQVTADGNTSASWRCALRLARGEYQFAANAKVEGVQPLPFGKHHGASLRVIGTRYRSDNLVGSTDWSRLGVSFSVSEPEAIVELACELRASAGEACFDLEELQLRRSAERPAGLSRNSPEERNFAD